MSPLYSSIKPAFPTYEEERNPENRIDLVHGTFPRSVISGHVIFNFVETFPYLEMLKSTVSQA